MKPQDKDPSSYVTLQDELYDFLNKQEKERIKKENRQRALLEREEKRRNKPITTRRHRYFAGDVKDRLTILSITDGPRCNARVLCRCECGNIKEYKHESFRFIKSCGCLQREKSSTHGMSSKYGKKWYDKWRSMVKRCYNVKCSRYKDYGGRGITICDRWLEPNGVGCENYYNDIHTILGSQPSPKHSLDRIDNDGNYEISNLRWATQSVQAKNQRRWLMNK